MRGRRNNEPDYYQHNPNNFYNNQNNYDQDYNNSYERGFQYQNYDYENNRAHQPNMNSYQSNQQNSINLQNHNMNQNQQVNNASNVTILSPSNYSQVQEAIDCLKNNQAIIIDLAKISDEISQRILDFLSGAIYALNGSQKRITKSVFLLTPNGVKIQIPINLADQLESRKKKW